VTIRPPTFAELTEACQRAYSDTGDDEYLKAIDGIQEARVKRQVEIYAAGGGGDADDEQPPPDLRLSSWAGTAWQHYRDLIVKPPPPKPQLSPLGRLAWWVLLAGLAAIIINMVTALAHLR
jgi:hypothetical protein